MDPFKYIMKPLPAHTRARTLQQRLGTCQNGSTRVQFTGRVAEELNPAHRPAEVEEHLEDDYFNELRSPEIIINDDFCDKDYNLNMTPTSIPLPVQRLHVFPDTGGDDGYQTYCKSSIGLR